MALSRKFIWVKIDRDETPALPKEFNVSAYPTLLTLGEKREKVHRLSGYRKPGELTGELNDALRRHALYLKGEEWDTPAPRPAKICDRGKVETLMAPSGEVPAGIAFLGGDLWVGQVGKLFRLDPKTAEVKATFELNRSIMDLCTDGEVLYGLESGWTAGRPIHVIDPKTGKTMRTIVTEANAKARSHGARGIVYRDGALYVLEGMRGLIHRVDPDTGEVRNTLKTGESWLMGLDFDGKHFVTGTRTHLIHLDAGTGRALRKTPVNYPLRAVGVHAGAIYLMEQPIFGYDKAHKRIQVWPQKTRIHRLALSHDE